MNTFTLGACFQHELHTGSYFMTFAPRLVALPYDSFRSKEITDIGILNEYFELIDFHAALRYHLILKKIISLFISLQCCYHNDIATFVRLVS